MPIARRPPSPRGSRDLRRRGGLRAARRSRARPDGRLLRADRRRSVHVRPDRRRERAVRRLRDGRRAADGARHRRLSRSARCRSSVLTEILRGGQDKVREAGAVLIGGHSIIDEELKFGLARHGPGAPGSPAHERDGATPAIASFSRSRSARGSSRRRRSRARWPSDAALALHAIDDAQLNASASRAALALGVTLRDRRHGLRAARPRVRTSRGRAA